MTPVFASGLAALALGLAFATGAAAEGTQLAQAQSKTLRFGHLHSVDSPVHKGLVKAAEDIATKTQGRYKIAIFPSSQLGAAREMVSQVMDGTLDFIIEGAGSLGNLNRGMTLFEAPFIARDWDHLVKMLSSPYGQEQFRKLEAERNMTHLGTFYYGVRHFTTKTKPLNTAADARGLKIRVPEAPLFLAMIRALGATPTPMSLGEVYLSLQTGVAEGQENPLPTINNNKFFEVQKFLNLTGHVIVPQLVMMNAKAWTPIAAGDKAIFRAAFVEGGKVNDALTRADEERLVGFFKEKGMTVVNSDKASFQSMMSSVYELGEKDWGKGTFEAMQALR